MRDRKISRANGTLALCVKILWDFIFDFEARGDPVCKNDHIRPRLVRPSGIRNR